MEPIPRHNPSSLRIAGAIALLVALATIVVLSLGRFSAATSQDTRVDELVADFHAHEDEFRAIARLASVDATFGIDVASRQIAGDGIDADDVPGYGGILQALTTVGVQRLSASDHTLDVVTMSEGLAVSGRESGYYYSASSEVETVTLDVAREPNAPRMWFYPLGDGWYASDYRF